MKASHAARIACLGASTLLALNALGQVTAVSPYTLSVFAKSVKPEYSQPDSIAVLDDHVFIGFGNGVATDVSDGKAARSWNTTEMAT